MAYDGGRFSHRYAQSNTLSLPKTFQAVIIDTPVASGSIHSPYKQPVGLRLARGGLAVAYGMKAAHAVDPVVSSVSYRAGEVRVVLGGLGSGGLTAAVGSVGFEVLGNCSGTTLCWHSSPIAAASASGVVSLTSLPDAPRAVRYLWYLAPYGVQPFRAPVYANAAPIRLESAGAPHPAAARPGQDDEELLPLGPFVLPL